MMSRIICYLLVILIFPTLAGCVPATPIPTLTLPATRTPVPTPVIPTPTPTPTPTTLPEPGPTATLARTSQTDTAINICSPLRAFKFGDIWKIVRYYYEKPGAISGNMYSDDGHHGVDIAFWNYEGNVTIVGEPVQATLDGKIVAIVYNRPPYGNMVIVETPYEGIPPELIKNAGIPKGKSLYHLYAHMRKLEPLILGQKVTCGDLLGEVGQTGNVTGPHLHFETRYGLPGAVFTGGMAFYIGDVKDPEWRNYIRWRMSGEFDPFDPMLFINLPQPMPTPSEWTVVP